VRTRVFLMGAYGEPRGKVSTPMGFESSFLKLGLIVHIGGESYEFALPLLRIGLHASITVYAQL
jgi:hypothetical protein